MLHVLDPFVLHLFLEKYISNNIGNKREFSMNNFNKLLKDTQVFTEHEDIQLAFNRYITTPLQTLVSSETSLIIPGGYLTRGGDSGHAICWMFEPEKQTITMCNTGEGIKDYHKKYDVGGNDTTLFETVMQWTFPDKDEFYQKHDQILNRIKRNSDKKNYERVTNIKNIYKFINETLEDEYRTSFANIQNKEGTVGEYKYIVEDGYFYSEPQITGTCTFHSIMWLIFVKTQFKHDLITIMRKKLCEEGLEITTPKYQTIAEKNCYRLINVCNPNQKWILSSVSRFAIDFELEPTFDVSTSKKELNVPFLIELTKFADNFKTSDFISYLVHLHLKDMIIHLMQEFTNNLDKQKKNQTWVDILKKMTKIIVLYAKAQKDFLRSNAAFKFIDQLYFKVQADHNTVVTAFVAKMFWINENKIIDTKRLHRLAKTTTTFPRHTRSNLIDADVDILNHYTHYMFDLKRYNNDEYTFKNLPQPEINNTFYKEFWEENDEIHHYMAFVKHSPIITCLITSLTILFSVYSKFFGFKSYPKIKLDQDRLKFYQIVLPLRESKCAKIDDTLQNADKKFYQDVNLTTLLAHGKTTIADINVELNVSNVPTTCSLMFENTTMVAKTWRLNYKIKDRWWVKWQKFEMFTYIALLHQTEHCSVESFIFYTLKILKYIDKLPRNFKQKFTELIKNRDDLIPDLKNIICALLLQKEYTITLLSETVGYEVALYGVCAVMYLRNCSESNYQTNINHLHHIPHTNFWYFEYCSDENYVRNLKLTEIDENIVISPNNAVLLTNNIQTENQLTFDLSYKLSPNTGYGIRHVIWKKNDKFIINIPSLSYKFIIKGKTCKVCETKTSKKWTLYSLQITESLSDWGNFGNGYASFYVKSSDNILPSIITMASSGDNLVLQNAFTVWDKIPDLNEYTKLTNRVVHFKLLTNACIPEFDNDSDMYFIGALSIASGNSRCVSILYNKLTYANERSNDVYERFVALALQNQAFGTPYLPFLQDNKKEILRRKLDQQMFRSKPLDIEEETLKKAQKLIDSMLTIITKSSSVYPEIKMSTKKVEFNIQRVMKNILQTWSLKIKNNIGIISPSSKLAWLITINNTYQKIKTETDLNVIYSEIKRLHSVYVSIPTGLNDFENITAKFISKEQATFIANMSKFERSDIYQAIMGIGKSSVIMPNVVHALLTKRKNVIVVQPHHLVQTTYKHLTNFLGYLKNNTTYKILGANDIGLLDRFLKPTRLNFVAILSAGDIKRFILNTRITNKNPILNHKRLELIKKTTVLFDEIDDMSNPLTSELNIPVGKTRHPYIKKIKDMYLYYSVIFDKSQDPESDRSASLPDNLYEKIEKNAKMCQSKSFNMHYGISENKSILFAVPYKAVGTPEKGSSFSDPDIKHIFTCLTKCKSGLTHADIRLFKEHVDRLDFLGKNVIKAYLYEISMKLRKQKDPYEFLRKNSTQKIHTEIHKDKLLIKYYLINILLPSSEFGCQQQNISFMDIVHSDTCKKKVGFSGTTNMMIGPFDGKWQFNNQIIISKSAISKIKVTFKNPTVKLVQTDDDIYQCFRDFDVVIDEAGRLKDINVKQISNKIHKNVIYFDSQDKPQQLTTNRQKSVYYYDNKHTVGTDLTLPTNAVGIVLINLGSSLSKVAQAVFRMRNINMGQTIAFGIKSDFKLNLYKQLKTNEENQKIQRGLKHWTHAIRTQYRSEQSHKKKTYLNDIPYDLLEQPLPKINKTNFTKKRKKYANLNTGQIIEQQQQQEQEQEQHQTHRPALAYIELKKHVTLTDFRLLKHIDVKFRDKYPDLKCILESIVISPWAWRALAQNWILPMYIMTLSKSCEVYRIIIPGEALVLPKKVNIINKYGTCLFDKTKTTDNSLLLLMARILCGYKCPLHLQIQLCYYIERQQLRDEFCDLVTDIFRNVSLDLILDEYIILDHDLTRIIDKLKVTLDSRDISKYIFGVANYKNQLIEPYVKKLKRIIALQESDRL
jgi:hypothetical protein